MNRLFIKTHTSILFLIILVGGFILPGFIDCGFASGDTGVLTDYIVKIDGVEPILIQSKSSIVGLKKTYEKKGYDIEYIEPNFSYSATAVPNDDYFSQQMYLVNTKVHSAWNFTTGKSDIVIAVIDSGVDIDNPDLENNIWQNEDEIPGNNIDDDNNGFVDDYNGWDFIKNTYDPSPKIEGEYSFMGVNHGTIVAGVLSAKGNNGMGVAGVSWNSRIMPLRVLGPNGEGNTYQVARAIDYARENGADIINLSFVGAGKSDTLENAIKRAYDAGVVVVAAAGNEVGIGVDMTNDKKYPVCHDGPRGENWVIGVAATNMDNTLSSFSNYGSCVDIVAPGTQIFSTLYSDEGSSEFSNDYGGYWSGTSVAAPQVSGTLALISSLRPDLVRREVVEILLDNTDNIDRYNRDYQNKIGRGKLNAYKSIDRALSRVSLMEYESSKIITGAGHGGGPHVGVYNATKNESQFFASEKSKRYGINISSTDFDFDGREEVIASSGFGESPWVSIYSTNGELKKTFTPFDENVSGGVITATGDIDYDGSIEIVAVVENGYSSLVKIFDQNGKLEKSFYAFNRFIQSGLSLAVSDVNDDGFDEIIVATGRGVQGLVRVYNFQGDMISQFMPFGPDFTGGINIASGDLSDDGFSEIVVAPRSEGGPHVKVFTHTGKQISQFFAYSKLFLGGVSLAIGDIDGDGVNEIVTGAGPGGGPHVRIFSNSGDVLGQFFAYHPDFRGGVKVGVKN